MFLLFWKGWTSILEKKSTLRKATRNSSPGPCDRHCLSIQASLSLRARLLVGSEPTVLWWDKQARETPHISFSPKVRSSNNCSFYKIRFPGTAPQLPESESLEIIPSGQSLSTPPVSKFEIQCPVLFCFYLLWHQKCPFIKLFWKQCPDPWWSNPKLWLCREETGGHTLW